MKTVKIVIVLFVLLANGAIAKAQSQKLTAEERAAKQTEWMKTELNLSNEQEAKVSDINLRYVKAIADVRAAVADENDRKARIKELQKQRIVELRKVLTPEQREKLKQLVKEKRQNLEQN
ncbi:MAG: hypothetical protein JXR34_12840 [Bacteroidales bacterium]|nr:hypothetical protein [Bacteroidales bacterium]